MKATVLLSGGMDSTTLLAKCVKEFDEVHAFSVNYGQRHARELVSAAMVATHYRIPHEMADLSSLRQIFPPSSITSDEIAVPEGHYEAESMKATVVPNRNMIMLSVATAYAIAQGHDTVAYAAHAGDHAIYPDCRPVFATALGEAIALCDENAPRLFTPFIDMTKDGICFLGHLLEVPYRLTWSCYQGREKHCGKCGTCTERRESFQLAGVQDPTEYEDA